MSDPDDKNTAWSVAVYMIGPFVVVAVVLLGLWLVSHYVPIDWSEIP